jgi:hypothetical protein
LTKPEHVSKWFAPHGCKMKPPTRTVETWVFEGRPHLDTVETVELHEADQTEDLLRSLLDQV